MCTDDLSKYSNLESYGAVYIDNLSQNDIESAIFYLWLEQRHFFPKECPKFISKIGDNLF